MPTVNVISTLIPCSELVVQSPRAHPSVGIYLLPVLKASSRVLRDARAFLPHSWSALVIDSAISTQARSSDLV